MRIREVERLTGLNRKAVRLYEAKGLLTVERSDNDYREYDDEDVARLQRIAVLRRAGVSIPDIQLWQNGVISGTEMIEKRLTELRDEADNAESQVLLCRRLAELIDEPGFAADPDTGALLCSTPESGDGEGDQADGADRFAPHLVGFDIGTTTISAVVIGASDLSGSAVYTVTNRYTLPSDNAWEHLQDADGIYREVRRLLDFIVKRFTDIRAIGISGQMHGILFTDRDGGVLSPLYTWQDERAGRGSPSACDLIREKTGYNVPQGYGAATYYAEKLAGGVPSGATAICTVMDYAAMKLCGLSHPVTHVSNAASLGLYSFDDGDFDRSALKKLGIPESVMPRVAGDSIIGRFNGIPIAVPIGDNQADFIGAVRGRRDIALANFGTGSQITVPADSPSLSVTTPDIEIRPFTDGRYIISGSALCGGRAYAITEKFFRRYAIACGLTDKPQYDVMNRLAAEGIKSGKLLGVRTSFCGLRSDPDARGTISGISEDNYTPEALIAGTLVGMAEELYGMFLTLPHENVTSLIASGNAARLNPALPAALERVFGMKVTVTDQRESAAVGAALFAGEAAKANDIQGEIK